MVLDGGLQDRLEGFPYRLAQDSMGWMFPKNLGFQFSEACWKKTKSIFELAEKINQELKLSVDFLKI